MRPVSRTAALAAKERALEVRTKPDEEVASLQQERGARRQKRTPPRRARGLWLDAPGRLAVVLGVTSFTGLIVARWGLAGSPATQRRRLCHGRRRALGGLMILTFVAALRAS
ncbi:MAG: hypothetical protein U0793_05405 [Gemmataceae bacterium]